MTFEYDADGMLVRRTENGDTTLMLGKLYHHDLTLNVEQKHYFFNGQLIAQRNGTGVTFFLNDHLGSTTTTMRANGTKEADLRYDPWGNERYSENTTPTGYRYTSQRRDETLGLNDYNARYYDPGTGRFISADVIVPESIRPQSYNRYTYVLNNPLLLVDPSGNLAFDTSRVQSSRGIDRIVWGVFTIDEIYMLVDAIDVLLATLDTDDGVTILELILGEVLSEVISGTLGAIVGVIIEKMVEGGILGTLGAGVVGFIVGIIIGVLVSVGLALNQAAIENAILTLQEFQEGLLGALEVASPYDIISITIQDNPFYAKDELTISVRTPSPDGFFNAPSYYWNQETSLNKAAPLLVNMLLVYANNGRSRDNPIYFENWSGKVYQVSSYAWYYLSPKWGPISVNRCTVYADVC